MTTTRTTTTEQVLDALNSYSGENIWEDVIYRLPGYNEGATEAVDTGQGADVVIGDVHYEIRVDTWVAVGTLRTAWATYVDGYGDPDIQITNLAAPYDWTPATTDDEPVRIPLDQDGEPITDHATLDRLLDHLGYERRGEWSPHEAGVAATVMRPVYDDE